MSWHNGIIDAAFRRKNRRDCKSALRYECNKTRQALLKKHYMTIWHSLNCWKILSNRVLHLSNSSVLHYRQRPSHALEYFGWTSLWKEPQVSVWLTEMTSADQSEDCGPCRLCPAVGEDFGNKGKSLYPERALRALKHQTIICDPAMFHNNNPNRLKEEEMKVSGKCFFFFLDAEMIPQFKNKRKRIPTKWSRADTWSFRRHSSASSDNEGNDGNTHIIKNLFHVSLSMTQQTYYRCDSWK